VSIFQYLFLEYLNELRRNFPVLGISYDLGSISATSQPVVWAIGQTRDPAVQLVSLDGSKQDRSLFYNVKYTDDTTLVSLLSISGMYTK
jgi:hypothetical protein